MSEIIKHFIVSLFSSGIVIGVFAYIAKKYFDHYIDYHFKKKTSFKEIQQKAYAEIKNEFRLKSLQIYEETSKLSYRCLLEGRKVINKINKGKLHDLSEMWDSVIKMQCYFENQSYIDKDDFIKIHSYKDNLLIFIGECLSFITTEYVDEAQRKEKELKLLSLWQNRIESDFNVLRELFRIFSIKEDA